jgi:hypothetical protein
VIRSRSIPTRPPAFDREVLRAALFSHRGGPWPRTGQELAERVGQHFGREDPRWVASPEEALLESLLERLPGGRPGGPPIAAPAWGPPRFREVLERFVHIHWMPPAVGRLDPGADEVAEALDAGARAVLLAPLAGDCQALPEAARLCGEHGALLALDARWSVGSRLLDGGPERYGDLVLLPVDGEPIPSPCPGAILCGDPSREPVARMGPLAVRWGVACLVSSVLEEPRLRRALRLPAISHPFWSAPQPPPWTVAAASVRLDQSGLRSTQRALLAQTLRVHLGHVAGVTTIVDPPGFQAAGAAFALLTDGRDELVAGLTERGVPTLQALAGWLAPVRERDARSLDAAARALLLPLHPFFSRGDVDAMGEALRRASLGRTTAATSPTPGRG